MEVDPRLIPCLNIGVVGHVDHGKTTLVHAISGVWTDRHSEELKRGISIRLGYADATLYKCPNCPDPDCYSSSPRCPNCGAQNQILRTISFVDSPGHEALMATMLSGAALMDGALMVISATEPCPQPQTREHLTALDILGVRNLVVVQNKIDLVSREQALRNYDQIREFLKGTLAENAPIIPVSAQQRINLDVLIKSIYHFIPVPKRDLESEPLMCVARSFDVNKPGTPIQDLVGGVVGGSVIKGVFRVGDRIELRPGIPSKDGSYTKLLTQISSIRKGGFELEQASAGGLVGLGTKLDPALSKADGLVGKMVGLEDQLPPVISNIELQVKLFERVVGSRDQIATQPIRKGEMLMLSVMCATTLGTVTRISGDHVELALRRPICASPEFKAAISRQIGGRWRIIGHGQILS